ncbi:MAG: exodeoxyribonuclease VII large subunit [Clostridia bacterium]|nr:exodeoxyribonuclease VII large subunit [Clostridia bacterium]
MNLAYNAATRDGALSVGEVNRYLKLLMDNDALLSSVCVRGEISNLKYHSSGHLYFTLKDEEGEISAVMFRASAASMRFTARNGMKVRAYGRVSMYEKSGKCQIYVSAMTDDGVGALWAEFERLQRKLSAEGLFDETKKKKLPKLPTTIGIITSPTGAAVRDMINVTGRRWPSAKILLYPSLVQGADAPASLCRGLELLNAYNACDVIIIGRGGGSIEDLWAFNDERVVRAVAASEIPVISAVGHESDFTLCDFAADCRAPTPSAAAELAVPDRNEYRQRADDAFFRLEAAFRKIRSDKATALTSLRKRLELSSPVARLANEKRLLSLKSNALNRAINERYRRSKDGFSNLSGRLAAMNPLAVLGRGYSVAMDERGNLLTSANELKVGDRVAISFAEGRAITEVIETEPCNKGEIK